jgi:hypothetical protein
MTRFHRLASGALCALVVATASAQPAPKSLCLTLPKAQLGQGNNAQADVAEPVRTALGQYMAGPAVQLMHLDARIPVQIDAEATQKGCTYVLQTTVTQKKGKSTKGFLKGIAPLASALPMLGGATGSMGGVMAAQAVGQVAATAAAESANQDYMAAMTGAQQASVRAGDIITVDYALTRPGDPTTLKKEVFEAKATADGEDLLSPLLEQVATSVVTLAATG